LRVGGQKARTLKRQVPTKENKSLEKGLTGRLAKPEFVVKDSTLSFEEGEATGVERRQGGDQILGRVAQGGFKTSRHEIVRKLVKDLAVWTESELSSVGSSLGKGRARKLYIDLLVVRTVTQGRGRKTL